jgi:aminodeoxyfutalosine deaminase
VTDPEAGEVSVEAFCRRLPKVELHVHLEGTVTAERLRAIAVRDGLSIDPAAYASPPGESTWGAFLVAFMARLRALRRPDDWATALDDLLAAQCAQNVAWTEAFVTLTGALRGDYVLADVLRAMAEVEAGWHHRRCGARLILDAPRELGPDVCSQLVRLAAADTSGLIVGVGIGGDETKVPAEAFVEPFALAGQMGLRRTAHAGEHAGPESVVAAVTLLGAERIGHGLSAARDPRALALLVERGVTLDICPTSNRATGAWSASDGPHPVRRFVDAGVRISVGSDDPAIVGSSASGEWATLVRDCGITPHECLEICVDAVDAAALGEEPRARLNAQVLADSVDLREEAAALEEGAAS